MRRRIMLLVVGMTALVVLAFAVPVGLVIGNVVVDRAEQATTQQADSIATYLKSANRTADEITEYLDAVSSSTGRRSWVTTNGTTLGQPAEEVTVSAPQGARGDPGQLPGGFDGNGPGAQIHAVPEGRLAQAQATSPDGTTYGVQVFISNSALHAGEWGWWWLLVGGSVALMAIGVVAAELLTRRIVRPLLHTAQTAAALTAGNTAARASTKGPKEVREVGAGLNRLADRIDQLIAEERETVADLSHRLRTPLTALRLDAEALADPAESERISDHVGRLERLLTSVIRAARRPQREGRIPSCDATAVVGERVEFWSALAEDQNRMVSIALPTGRLLVRAADEDLGVAVDALLENIFAHTPEGTAFSVELRNTGSGAALAISDEGPGMPYAQPVRGRSDRGSTGLGLDIARRCAEAGGGSMTIGSSPSGGAVMTLLLPSP